MDKRANSAWIRRRFKSLQDQGLIASNIKLGKAKAVSTGRGTVDKIASGQVKSEKEWQYFREILAFHGMSEAWFFQEPRAELPKIGFGEGAARIMDAYGKGTDDDRAGLTWIAQHILYRIEPREAEPPPREMRVRPAVKSIKPANRRHELKRVKIHRDNPPPDYQLAAVFQNMAAGGGGVIEVSEDYWYIPKLSVAGRPMCAAKIRGDSMRETLLPGDTIILSALNGRDGITLPSLTRGKKKNSLTNLRKAVPHDSICALSIDDSDTTLKRVVYQEGKNDEDWHMIIEADNSAEWQSLVVTRQHSVRFLALFEALADEED